ncbi:MAG: S46 family peptidase [Bacteroidales bacterium]
MKKTVFTLALLAGMASSALADQGMIQPFHPDKKVIDKIQLMGLKIPYDSLFNENKSSVKDAVVIFGAGCTGVAVSDQGLVFTNHHCGFGAIQSLSNEQHDYLRDGFASQTKENEIPAEELNVSFLVSSTDVTKRIESGLTNLESEIRRSEIIDSISKVIVKEVEKDSLLDAKVTRFYEGNAYRLLVYKVYKDVRLVFAPPASIGKFGGETDNWMWPRHTGDFSVFRVYADSLGNPVKYNKNNVPFHPKYVATISTDGYQPDDLTMTIGYPGTTNRYLSAAGVEEMVKTVNIPRIKVREVKQQIWKKNMLQSQAIRIKYDAKFARSANYYKNSIGMNAAIRNNRLIEDKQNEEMLFTKALSAHPELKAKYDTVLAKMKEGYLKREVMRTNLNYAREALRGSSDLLTLATTYIAAMKAKAGRENSDKIVSDMKKIYKNSDLGVEKEVLAAMLEVFQQNVSEAKYLPPFYEKIHGNYTKFTEKAIRKSVFADSSKLFKAIRTNDFETIEEDPIYKMSLDISKTMRMMQDEVDATDNQVKRNERLYMREQREVYPDSIFHPDANFTMRLSYGSVKPYKPRDGVSYNYFTTTKGLIEKNITENPDYFLKPDYIAKLEATNKVKPLNTCFLTTNDITGGNSGSPVFNKDGRLIGLAFDGNWESLSGNLRFDNDLQRCIVVDIRYMIYSIDHLGGMPQLLNELKFKK